MMEVANRRTGSAKLLERFPGARFLDVTSQGPLPWRRFSPFFPHGGIPIPFTPGAAGASVEGIWQGLKVFEKAGVDPESFGNDRMKGLKRTEKRFGPCLGHQKGLHSNERLSYLEARRAIYLPAYLWILENRLQPEVEELKSFAARGPLVFLDYNLNTDWQDLSKPLSHAALLKSYLEGSYPPGKPATAFAGAVS